MSEKNELPKNESQPDKPHLSASSLELFAKCPEAYRRRYVEGEKSKPNVAMIKGKAFHAAVEANMNAKMQSGKELPIKYLADIANDVMSDGIKECEDNDDDGSHARDVRKQVEFHKTNQAPDYQPKQTEIPFRIELDSCGHDYVGYIDMTGTLLETGEPVIVDWKTSKKKPANNSQHDSMQLTGYYASQADELGKHVELRLDYITTSKTKQTRHVLKTYRDADDIAAIAQRINIASKTIEAGIFPPASVDSAWWCGASWCQYYSSCKYVNPKRREKEHAREQLKEAMEILSTNKEEKTNE